METSTGIPRSKHAGCGHLCLTCGAQAAVRAVTSDVVHQICSIFLLAIMQVVIGGAVVALVMWLVGGG